MCKIQNNVYRMILSWEKLQIGGILLYREKKFRLTPVFYQEGNKDSHFDGRGLSLLSQFIFLVLLFWNKHVAIFSFLKMK